MQWKLTHKFATKDVISDTFCNHNALFTNITVDARTYTKLESEEFYEIQCRINDSQLVWKCSPVIMADSQDFGVSA